MTQYITLDGMITEDIRNYINTRNDVVTHSKNYIINPLLTEYMPVQFININQLSMDLDEGKISEFKKVPFYAIERSISIPDNLTSGMRYITKDSIPSYNILDNDVIYFSNNMLILNDSVLFCIAIPSNFFINTFNNYIGDFSSRPFMRMLVENQIHENEDLLNIIHSVFMKRISPLYAKFSKQAVVFVNTKAIEEFAKRYGITGYGHFLDYYKGRYRIIDESTHNYISSKLFVSPEVPTFNDIEEPDRIVKEILGSWSSPDIQADFPYTFA